MIAIAPLNVAAGPIDRILPAPASVTAAAWPPPLIAPLLTIVSPTPPMPSPSLQVMRLGQLGLPEVASPVIGPVLMIVPPLGA